MGRPSWILRPWLCRRTKRTWTLFPQPPGSPVRNKVEPSYPIAIMPSRLLPMCGLPLNWYPMRVAEKNLGKDGACGQSTSTRPSLALEGLSHILPPHEKMRVEPLQPEPRTETRVMRTRTAVAPPIAETPRTCLFPSDACKPWGPCLN